MIIQPEATIYTCQHFDVYYRGLSNDQIADLKEKHPSFKRNYDLASGIKEEINSFVNTIAIHN